MTAIQFILIVSYLVIGVAFGVAIQFERQKQQADYNFFQVFVPAVWPLWVIWYLFVIIRDYFRK